MVKIGLLSDTHGFIHPRVFDFFKDCHEIWHAGDIGTLEVYDRLSDFKPLRAVYGNIDGTVLRQTCPQYQLFTLENVKVLMTHIGGYPRHYESDALQRIRQEKPNLFISGHSHILKVQFDPQYNLLHMNPGAAGNQGFHQHITFLRFDIDQSDIQNLEIFEIERR